MTSYYSIMDKLLCSNTGECLRRVTLGELQTDIERCCQDCGFVGHSKGRCACDHVTIEFSPQPEIKSIELMEEKQGWRRGKFMPFSHKYGQFRLKQFLLPGRHVFKFFINGQEWKLSPNYPVIRSPQGILNNFIVIEPVNYPSISIEHQKEQSNQHSIIANILLSRYSLKLMLRSLNLLIKDKVNIKVYGSWDDWRDGREMEYHVGNGKGPEYYCSEIHLPIGKYEYKFTIDGKWIIDPFRMVKKNDEHLNHHFDLNKMIKPNKTNPIKIDLQANIKLPVTEVKVDALELFKIYGHSMNVVDSKIWIFGGCFQSSFLGSMIVVDPKNHSADIFQAMDVNAPEQLGFHRTITYGNKILMFGGHNEGTVIDKYSAFDTLNNSWTSFSIKKMPQKREMFTLNHKHKTTLAYLFGGYFCSQNIEEERFFNDFYALHLDSMYFEKLEALNPPNARCHHTAEIIQSKLYVFGGMQIAGDSKTCFNDIWVINIESHKNLEWSRIETYGEKPCPRYGHTMVKWQNQLIVHGGINSCNNISNYLWDLWVFDTANSTWNAIPIEGSPEKLGRAFHTACVNDGNMIIYGGKFKQLYSTHW